MTANSGSHIEDLVSRLEGEIDGLKQAAADPEQVEERLTRIAELAADASTALDEAARSEAPGPDSTPQQ